MNKVILTILISVVVACDSAKKETAEDTVDGQAEKAFPTALISLTNAHHLDKYFQKAIIAFDIELYFSNKLRLAGTIYSRTNSTKVLVDKVDGTQLLFDGQQVFISPDTASMKGARFDALTWSYFALAPFKFKDKGTNWVEHSFLPLDSGNTDYPSLKLTFGENVGDAPDDWYIIFKDDETQLLKAMAYIVTFGETPQEEAAKNPHAIVYSDYQLVDGIPFATTWKFRNWSEKEGLGDLLGEAKLTNIRFIQEPDSLFTKGSDSQLVPLK
jgi:hypothetical protein